MQTTLESKPKQEAKRRQIAHDSEQPIRLLQLTDCHIGPDNSEELLGLNTNESLNDVIAHVREHHARWDLLLTTGDIANNGGARTYVRFLEILEKSGIDFSAFGWLPGNHDSPVDMNEAMNDEQLTKELHIGNWLILLLNTQVPGHTHGNLVEAELNLLDEALSNNRDKHVLIFMHHQPVPVGCAWVDTQKVRSEYAFFKIIDQYEHVKAVVWGHVHQEFSQRRNNVQLLATPSTSIQFKSRSDDFAVDRLMPGYRWFVLNPDGSFETSVERIADKQYPIQFTSQGY
ncbi:3',5'-cyclic-AMP phosphodiesterase [Gilvimarinus sp. F26214L]|uniref:3',5'-cyclic-AMP phosphodiesterase n=1 Tax=Gilvimarinus sp. DZF01 TaxID=3461371 RepID=UPI004045CC98